MAGLSLAVFAGLAVAVCRSGVLPVDAAILTWLAQHASPQLTRGMLLVSATANTPFVVGALLLLAVAWRRQRSDWLALAVATGGAVIFNPIVKQMFGRARPTLFPPLAQAQGYSFPSGHSQTALAFYGVLAYVLACRVSPSWRVWVYVAAAVWIGLVGLSRNYLLVHYPSDVLAAFALTIPWDMAVVFCHRCHASLAAGRRAVRTAESRS